MNLTPAELTEIFIIAETVFLGLTTALLTLFKKNVDNTFGTTIEILMERTIYQSEQIEKLSEKIEKLSEKIEKLIEYIKKY